MSRYDHAKRTAYCNTCNKVYSAYSVHCVTCLHSQRALDAMEPWRICREQYNKRTNMIKEMEKNMINMKDLDDVKIVIGGKVFRPTSVQHDSLRDSIRVDTTLDDRLIIGKYAYNALKIKDVIFNPPATIVFWGDNTKTVVKCQDGEEFDPEKGITMAFFKKMHDNKGSYFNEIAKWTEKYYKALTPSAVVSQAAKSFGESFSAGITTSSISDKFDSLPCMKSDKDFIKKFADALVSYIEQSRDDK